MKNEFDICEFDVVNDVIAECERLLESGNQTKICEEIEVLFSNEIEDEDDAPFVYLALAAFFLENDFEIPSNLTTKVVSYLSATSYLSKRLKTESDLYGAFLAWKKTFLKDVKAVSRKGGAAKDQNAQNSFYIRKWKRFDVFTCELDVPNLSKTKLFLFVWDNIKWANARTPVAYFAIESKTSQTDEVVSWDKLVFLPTSKTSEMHPVPDFRYLIIEERRLPPDMPPLTYLGSCPDIPFPEHEYIPPDPNFYGRVRLGNLQRVVELGLELLKK